MKAILLETKLVRRRLAAVNGMLFSGNGGSDRPKDCTVRGATYNLPQDVGGTGRWSVRKDARGPHITSMFKSSAMLRLRRLCLVFLAMIGPTCPSVDAGMITLDICPAGTTSNQNIYGTSLSGGIADWSGASYRDYQFNLRTGSGTASFDQFSVLLSAQLRNQTVSYGNVLRASLWSGSIVSNPLLADSLTTISASNHSFTTSGYSPKVALTGATFTSQTISTTPSTFFFRMWAEGTINSGYQTKMAALTTEMQSITMTETIPVDGTIGVDTDNNGSIDTFDAISAPVPEIDPAGMGAVLAIISGTLGLLERRRLKAA